MPGRDLIRRVLILGGTGEARDLAARAVAAFGSRVEIVTSLAGRTRLPASPAGAMRVGGFGGAEGLATYLRDSRIDAVIDATHPFAATMSANARDAAAASGVPLLILSRPVWMPGPGDRWTEVADATEAASVVATRGCRVFLSFGGRELDAFAALRDKWFLVRRIDPPEENLPLAQYALSLGRGPFSVEDERRLLEAHRIDVVVTKASGGEATRAKLDAARALGLPVVMIRRPPAVGPGVSSAEDALRWLDTILFGQGARS